MKLNDKEFKRYKELVAGMTAGKLTDSEVKELAKLEAKKKAGNGHNGKKVTGRNDFNWWNKYPELTKDAANIPFSAVAGEPEKVLVKPGGNEYTLHLPVGARIDYIRTPGKCVDENSAFNYQMRQIWLDMHRKYRGLGAYEWADLGIGLFAIMNVFADIARAERVYGIANLFHARNRSVPEAILFAAGIDPLNITGAGLADYRYQINRLITKAKILCLPKGFSVLESFIATDSLVFKDADNVRAQWFLYDCAYHYYYDAAGSTAGGVVKAKLRTQSGNVYNGTATQSLADVIADLEFDLNQLLGDTDIARMCSDILACFGENVTSMDYMPEQYIVEPIKDDTRLLQLHNATLCGAVSTCNVSASVYTWDTNCPLVVWQLGGYVRFELSSVGTGVATTVTSAGSYWHGVTQTAANMVEFQQHDPFLNIWKDEVSVEDVVEMTRLTVPSSLNAIVDNSGTTYRFYYLDNFGTQVVKRMTIFSNAYNGTFRGLPFVTFSTSVISGPALSQDQAFGLSCLDWHPIIWSAGSTATVPKPVADFDNYCRIARRTLQCLHDACTLSGFKLDAAIIVK